MAHTCCPDEERLADFTEGRLDAQDRATLETHLEGCDTCFEVVVLTREAMQAELAYAGSPALVTIPERAAREKVKALFAPKLGMRAVFRMVRGALDLVRSAGAEWAPVAVPSVRGGATDGAGLDLWESKVRVGELDLQLEVERSGEGCLIAAGLTTRGGTEAPAGLSVALVTEGKLLAFQPATGEPSDLAEVGAGEYRIEIRRGDEVTGHATLALEDAA